MKIRIMGLNWAYRHIKLDVNHSGRQFCADSGLSGDIYKG